MSNQELTVAEETIEEVATLPPASETEPAVAQEAVASEDETATSSEPAADQETDTVSEPVAEQQPEAEAVEDNISSEESSESPAAEGDMSNIHSLKIGQRLTGTVKNLAEFGAFVDVGIPQDGLVHISKLAKHKVEKVSDVVSEGQEVEVWVKKVDTKRGRLSLTMIKPVLRKLKDLEEEAEIEGTITRLESYGAFVDIESDRDGLVHISQITHEYIKHPEEALKVGDTVKVKVLSVNRKKRQIDLSIKALLPEPVKEEKPQEEEYTRASSKPRPERAQEDRSRYERVKPSKTQGNNRRRREDKKPKETFVVQSASDEPMLTAMAVAYAALQDKDDDDTTQAAISSGKNNRQERDEMSEIVNRTLAGQDNS